MNDIQRKQVIEIFIKNDSKNSAQESLKSDQQFMSMKRYFSQGIITKNTKSVHSSNHKSKMQKMSRNEVFQEDDLFKNRPSEQSSSIYQITQRIRKLQKQIEGNSETMKILSQLCATLVAKNRDAQINDFIPPIQCMTMLITTHDQELRELKSSLKEKLLAKKQQMTKTFQAKCKGKAEQDLFSI